jgi:signal transduction histidine kinase
VVRYMLHRRGRKGVRGCGTPPQAKASCSTVSVADDLQPMHSSRQMLEMLVCDNGMGIPLERHERLVDRFHRVETCLTRKVSGLGLGLTIVSESLRCTVVISGPRTGRTVRGVFSMDAYPLTGFPACGIECLLKH